MPPLRILQTNFKNQLFFSKRHQFEACRFEALNHEACMVNHVDFCEQWSTHGVFVAVRPEPFCSQLNHVGPSSSPKINFPTRANNSPSPRGPPGTSGIHPCMERRKSSQKGRRHGLHGTFRIKQRHSFVDRRPNDPKEPGVIRPWVEDKI